MIWALTAGLSIKDIPFIHPETKALILPSDRHPPPPVDPRTIQPDHVFVPVPDLPPTDTGGTRDTGLTLIDTRPMPPAVTPGDHGPVGLMATHTIPPYPAMAVRLGTEGTVLLRLIVAADGRVIDAQVLRTSGAESLDRAAQAWVVAHWRYQPAVRGGVAAQGAVDVAVKFSLKNAG